MQIKFRPIAKEDLKTLVAINNMVQTNPWTQEAIKNEIERGKGWVATSLRDQKEEITGYIFVREVSPELEIMTLAVALEYQRNGVGQKLLGEVIKKSSKVGQIWLEVSHTNEAALSLYKKMGFETFNTRKAYYPDGTDAVCMKLKLAKT